VSSRRAASPHASAAVARARDPDVRAGEVDRLARPQAVEDGEELAGAGVALLLAELVAEAPLLGVVAADDDVEQQAAAADALVRRGHLRGDGRAEDPGPEGDEEREGRRLLVSAAVMTHASSHHELVGVRAPVKPFASAARATWAR
jgi:hypothetical protein